MKKFLGILFLLILIAAGVCAYFFPGIPYYYKCTHDLEFTENIWEEAPKDLPALTDGYGEYSTDEVRVTAWNDMEAQRSSSKDQIIWENVDNGHFISIYTEQISESSDFLDMTGITHSALDAYCKDAEKTTPENNYEFVKLVASITMKDFDIHSYKNSKTFYKIMKIKSEEFYTGENFPIKFYPVDGVGYRGYLLSGVDPDGDHGYKNYAIINVYPEKDKHTRYIITLSVTDWNEVLAIAESIKLK